jgi:hypothetical protein
MPPTPGAPVCRQAGAGPGTSRWSRGPPQRTHGSSLALVVILAVIPPRPTAANQTALNGMPSQPELPRPYWGGLSGRLAVIS